MAMLVGRDREVSELEVALDRLVSGTGTLFLFAGEPGIGKTRLASEVMQRARTRGVRTSWGRCWEAGGSPALWPWREALEGLGIAFPEPASVAADPKEARFALFRDIAAALGRAAASEPCVVALDDLHAADQSSLMLLEWVAARIDTLPLVVVGTYRDLEARLSPDTSASLGRASRTARVFQLAPLAADAVSSLVRDSIANADDQLIATIFETTRGNPLFVDELVREARSASSTTPARIPLGVREIIRQRLSLISEGARRVLEAGAVLGVEFATANVGRMDAAAAAVLDDAERSGLVTARGERFRFAHALYREALYHDLPRERRREMHREAARALAAGDAPLSEIAHHLLEAGPAVVAEADDHAIRAAYQALAVFAYEDASALLERARLAELDRELRCRVLIAIGEVRLRSGDPS
jgi:predicted ATPase